MKTSRTALLTATLVAASAPTAAFARPTIIVDEAIPFSADDLANAVSIRADSEAAIHVTRQGDSLVITVGDHARSVAVDPAIEPHDLARVVALVIVALDTGPGTPAPAPPPLAPPAPLPSPAEAPPGAVAIAAPGAVGSTVLFGSSGQLPPPKNWTLRFQVGYSWDNGRNSRPVMASLSRRLGPAAHLVVGVGYDQNALWTGNEYNQAEVDAIPLRAGLELRYRWLAVEGGLAATRWDDFCMGPTFATGGYASARAYLLPIGAIQNRMFVETGIRHVTSTMSCSDEMGYTLENRETTVAASLGLELPL